MTSPDSAAMALRQQWTATWQRLRDKDLLDRPHASLSLRIPGGDEMWFGTVEEPAPRRVRWSAAKGPSLVHAAIYAARNDAGGIAVGGGPFGQRLADFDGQLPQVFDEQVRHIGRMGGPVKNRVGLPAALGKGGNAVLVDGVPACLGMTAMRLVLNAELFEKCSKSYVLAAATGGRIKPLPWIVRYVANGRLLKDERRASACFTRGELPPEVKGY